MDILKIKRIPKHIAYMAEYDIESYNDFFDLETGGNCLQDLEDLMRHENPDVIVPEIPNDYNYFTQPLNTPPHGKIHVKYYDMVNKAGSDSVDGKYRFVEVPEIKAAIALHKGSFSQIYCSLESISGKLAKENLAISGDVRISAIHGPWDKQTEDEYLLEIQIPVK